MFERREILARLSRIYLAIEGGSGTEHEAEVAMNRCGVAVVPVGGSGGHAGELYGRMERPAYAAERDWETLARAEAKPREVAQSVLNIVSVLLGRTQQTV